MNRQVAPRRGRRAVVAFAAAAFAISILNAAPASAATLTVDDDGDQCPAATFTTIQSAVNAAVGGTDDIRVCNGIYVEQLDVNKQLTIDGDGAGTIIYAPDTLATKFTTAGGTVPHKPVVYVHDVAGTTIQDLTVDGAGKGNANNRIVGIAYHQAGGTVQDTRIEDVRNTPLDGVQAGVAFHALADNGTDRTVNLDDSTLVRFQKNGTVFSGPDLTVNATDNTVTGAGPVGVPLPAQNGFQVSGDAGGTVDGNTISGIDYTPKTVCSAGVLLSGTAAGVTVSDNTVTGTFCALFSENSTGTQLTGNVVSGSDYAVTLFDNPATVNGNRITGTNAAAAGGIYADQSAAAGNVTYTVNGNSVTGYSGAGSSGIAANDFDTGDAQTVTMTAAFNRISGNAIGATADNTAALTAENNWWGCNEGPNQPGCDTTATSAGGTLDADPWLVLGLAANPTSIQTGGATSQLTASLTRNSNGNTVGAGFPNGVNVAFATSLGSVTTPGATNNGVATSTLTSGAAAGTANTQATLDSETVTTPVTFTAPPSTGGGGVAGEVSDNTAQRNECIRKAKRKYRNGPATDNRKNKRNARIQRCRTQFP